MNLSHAAIKRVVSDYDLPITIFSEPLLSYQIEEYRHYKNCAAVFLMAEKEIDSCGGEEAFFQKSKTLLDTVCNEIKSKPEYNDLVNADMTFYSSKFKVSGNLYIQPNDGKEFTSIDLVKANFQALNGFNPKLFNDKNEWEDFLGQYTNSEYFLKSKRFREIIFGNLCPQITNTLCKYLMQAILDRFENCNLSPKIVCTTTDEIIFERNDEISKNILDFTNYTNIAKIKIENFNLKRLKPYDFYVKQFINNNCMTFKIKNTPSIFFGQAYKHIMNWEVKRNDLAFYHEKMLAYFEKPLEFEKCITMK